MSSSSSFSTAGGPSPGPAPPNEHAVTSPAHLQALLSADLARPSLLNFWAPWAGPCAQMNAVVRELAARHPRVLVLDVDADADATADVAESFEVASVPTFVILRVRVRCALAVFFSYIYIYMRGSLCVSSHFILSSLFLCCGWKAGFVFPLAMEGTNRRDYH